jgi:hypothetical protein
MSLQDLYGWVDGKEVTYCQTNGTIYYLFTGDVTLKDGRDTTIFVFFPKDRVDQGQVPSKYQPITLPSGFYIDTINSGMPIVKRK